jgi:RNA-directed DNA polymerase
MRHKRRRRIRSRSGRGMPLRTPRPKARTTLLRKLKPIFRRHRSGPLRGFIEEINPIVRGWGQYVAFGHSSRCVSYVRRWVAQKSSGNRSEATRLRLEAAVESSVAV